MGTRSADEALLTKGWTEDAPANREVPGFGYDVGFPGDYDFAIAGNNALPIDRKFLNYGIYLTSLVGKSVNTCGGALPWLSTINYQEGAVVTQPDVSNTNSILYKATQANTNASPELSPGVWQPYQVANNLPQFYVSTGLNNTYNLTSLVNFAPVQAYFDGLVVEFEPNFLNTGTVVVNVNNLGDVPVVDSRLNALIYGELRPGTYYRLLYVGGAFVILQNLLSEPAVIVDLYGRPPVLGGSGKGILQSDIVVTNGPGGAPDVAILTLNFQNSFDDTLYQAVPNQSERVRSDGWLIKVEGSGGDPGDFVLTVNDDTVGEPTIPPSTTSCQLVTITTVNGVSLTNGNFPPDKAESINILSPFANNLRIYHNSVLPILPTVLSVYNQRVSTTSNKKAVKSKDSSVSLMSVAEDVKSTIVTESSDIFIDKLQKGGKIVKEKHVRKKRVFDVENLNKLLKRG